MKSKKYRSRQQLRYFLIKKLYKLNILNFGIYYCYESENIKKNFTIKKITLDKLFLLWYYYCMSKGVRSLGSEHPF